MTPDTPHLEMLAYELAEQRSLVEVELVASVLSDPDRGVTAAERAGVAPALFERDDLRAIYVAADYGREHDVPTVLRFARFLLRNLWLWDDDDARSFTRGMRWGHESLVALATSYPGPAAVQCHADALVRISARMTSNLGWRTR